MRKSDLVITSESNSEKASTPTAKLGAKLKQIVKKVRHSDGDNVIPLNLETEDQPEARKKVSIRDSADITSAGSSRKKSLEEENLRTGRAKSLGFHSIKAGLGRKEYEDFIKKSPIKPLALKMAENQSAAGGARRSILVRMKTESSFNGVLLPPLNRSSKDLTARSDTDLLAGALEATEAKHLLLRASLSMRGSNINSPATSVTRQTNDDYSKDGFESSLDSLEKHVIEEERLAKEAEAPKLNAIAPFLLNELQADDLIDRRFGWQRTGNIAALHNNKFDQLNAHSRSNDDEIPSKPKIPKLGEISPAPSMRQASMRGAMLGAGTGKAPPPGKLTRKATMANLTSGNGPSGGGTATEPEPTENILEHYSGLLFRDPMSPNTWQELNSPKKTKTGLFQTQKQSLSAGRNINAYRPWGPARPVDPLDAILEKTINQSLVEGEGNHSSHDRPRSRTGRKRTNSRERTNRKRRTNVHHKPRRDSSANRNFSPFSSSASPTKITRAHSAHSTHSRGRSESPRSRSRSRSRVHSAEGTRASSARESPRRDELRSGIVLESSMELSKMNQSTTHSVGNNHHSSHDSAMVVATSRPTSSNAHYSPSAPSSASGKRRSPLIINFIKAPGL